MRRFVIALGLILVATVAAGAVLMMAGLVSQPGGPADPEVPVATPLKPQGTWDDGQRDAAALRRIAPGDAVQAALVREEPRAPLSALGLAPVPDPLKPPEPPKAILRYRLLHKPVATAAGLIEVEGHMIALQGIEPVPVDRTCGEAQRPCGMMARTAFRNWLRGRSIHCSVPDVPAEKLVETECAVAGEDPAAWLVSQGWAEPKPEAEEYAAAAAAAGEKRLGLHAF